MLKPKIILSLPRSGTHFIWSRYVTCGNYQLIYDADMIQVLSVLQDNYSGELDFLYPPIANPHYNFQFDSLNDFTPPINAKRCLDLLMEKYGASTTKELMEKSLLAQDARGKRLFSINRFVYTCRYSFIFQNFEWSIEMAVRALKRLYEALMPYEATFVMVIRGEEIQDWIDSLLRMSVYSEGRMDIVRERLKDLRSIVKCCLSLGIPIYYMRDVIKTINKGCMDFEDEIDPVGESELEELCQSAENISLEAVGIKWVSRLPVRISWGSFRDYLLEKDPIKRTSIVRSIGTLPHACLKLMPVLGRRLSEDLEGVKLNNARIYK